MPSDQTYKRVLALDTATYTQSIAVLDGETLLESLAARVEFRHSQNLLPNLNRVLDNCELDISDFDLLAVGRGPGGFTGLRVSMALAKSFAMSTSVPIVGVSTLRALAYRPARLNPNRLVAAMYDARRKEVYAGGFEWNNGELETVIGEKTVGPDSIKAELLELSRPSAPITVVGNGPDYYDSLANWNTEHVTLAPTALTAGLGPAIAELGRARAKTDGVDALDTLEPHYIRPSDAELNAGS